MIDSYTTRRKFLRNLVATGATAGLASMSASCTRLDSLDNHVRLFLLNHTPDECVVIQPQVQEIIDRFNVADGLVQMCFNYTGDKAYFANVVDITNKISVFNANTRQPEETIEVDGIPQGLIILPGDRFLAMISGSRADFMSGRIDVIDLASPNPADPSRRKVVWRASDPSLRLINAIAMAWEGRYAYCTDARQSIVYVLDLFARKIIKSIDIRQAAMGICIPPFSQWLFTTSIKSESLYIVNRYTMEIERVVSYGRFRKVAATYDGRIVFAPIAELFKVIIIETETGNIIGEVKLPKDCEQVQLSPDERELYVVSRGDDGQIYTIDLERMTVGPGIKGTGDFRDFKIQPVPRLQKRPIGYPEYPIPVPDLSAPVEGARLKAWEDEWGVVIKNARDAMQQYRSSYFMRGKSWV